MPAPTAIVLWRLRQAHCDNPSVTRVPRSRQGIFPAYSPLGRWRGQRLLWIHAGWGQYGLILWRRQSVDGFGLRDRLHASPVLLLLLVIDHLLLWTVRLTVASLLRRILPLSSALLVRARVLLALLVLRLTLGLILLLLPIVRLDRWVVVLAGRGPPAQPQEGERGEGGGQRMDCIRRAMGRETSGQRTSVRHIKQNFFACKLYQQFRTSLEPESLTNSRDPEKEPPEYNVKIYRERNSIMLRTASETCFVFS